MRTISAGYFREGPFAGARPGELFASYICVACGARAPTWAAFRAHRGACAGAEAVPLGRLEPPASGVRAGADWEALDALAARLEGAA